MKIASFTMLRNEAQILGPFMDQLYEFFDYQFLLNHESTDGSDVFIRKGLQSGAKLFHLKATGYPQSEVATYFTRKIFEETDADWLFFLDCDEFLPFSSRADLVHAIERKGRTADALTLCWRNILPERLDGSDIFSGKFLALPDTSKFSKISISRRLYERVPDLVVNQGYHGVDTRQAGLTSEILTPAGLLHIPVQSKLRFASKVGAAGKRLIDEQSLSSRNLGYHWVGHYLQLMQQGMDNFDFAQVALSYPGSNTPLSGTAQEIEFGFDYVKSAYQEKPSDFIADLIRGQVTPEERSSATLIYDDVGTIITSFAGANVRDTIPSLNEGSKANTVKFDLDDFGIGQFFSDLVEPLFSLPITIPPTAWVGHIPFMFVIFKLLRPRSYVELGTHYGASLIAAASAARAYSVPSRLYGIDSWEGDPHAGHYQGDQIHRDLTNLVDRHFNNVRLMRTYFDDASKSFEPGSIDLLHIDGLHTYDAVKHDFLTWLPKMTPRGVILFHDTTVRNEGFGVYRFWSEIERQFTTFQFFNSHGLGVLLLDQNAEGLEPFMRVVRSKDFSKFYQSLVTEIGNIISPRMAFLENDHRTSELHRLKAEQENLTEEIAFLRAQAEAYGVMRTWRRGLSRIVQSVWPR